jgi:nucleotide-binding universal stress UspA family protein
MYSHILAPLDGSELAECILPHLETISRGSGRVKISLVRVVDPDILPATDPTSAEFGLTKSDRNHIVKQRTRSAETYLKALKQRLIWDWADITTRVIVGPPAESLANYANQEGIDLIIIASHGRSGIQRLIMGSIADHMLHSSCSPVLLVRAPGCAPRN